MTTEEADSFMQELNELTKKYGVIPVRVDGPTIEFKEWKYGNGTEYIGHYRNGENNNIILSAPWGG